MKDRHNPSLPQNKDRHLDVPAEANQDKHINFLDTNDENKKDDINEDSPFFIPNNTPLKEEIDKKQDASNQWH